MMNESLGAIPPLPTLVWEYILDCIRWGSHSTLQALNLTCQGFRRLVLPILFETLHIHFLKYRDTGRQLLQNLQGAGNELFWCVRIFIISGCFLDNREGHMPSHLSPVLLSLVERLPRLVVFRWRGRFPLPYELLQHLNARQLVPNLYFEGWLHNLLHNLPVAPFKQVSHCIRSLSVAFGAREELDKFKPVVLALPCLDRLDMKYRTFSKPASAPSVPLFSLGSGDSIPPLRTLCLTNFTVDSERVNEWDQCHHIRHLGIDGGAESLELLTFFTGKIPDMTSLALRICDGTSRNISDDLYSQLDMFLQSVKSLAAFTAYDLPKGILPLLEGQIRCLFTFEELQKLASELPQLQRLGIDLRFKGHLSYDVLSGAAYFPSLEHLELNANFPYSEDGGTNGWTPMVDSWLNAAIAEKAFRYVVGEKLHYERITPTTVPWSPFTALDIKVGEWEPYVEDYSESISPSNPIFMYACRWAGCRPGKVDKVDTVRLRYLANEYPIQDDRYEQALARAGLWSVSKVLSGPGSL